MSTLMLMEVQRALYAKLHSDGILTALVPHIYDSIPQHTPAPYLLIGQGTQSVTAVDGIMVSECQLELSVFTDTGVRKTALSVLNRLYALLHLSSLVLTGLQCVQMRMEEVSTTLTEQGTLLKGRMELFVTVAEAS